MKNGLIKIILSLSIIALIAGCGPRGNMTITEKRQVVMDMEKETLARLYSEAPETKEKIKKAVIIVVPHTSWHDFYIGVFVRKLLKTQNNFLVKKELFIWPLGYYFRWMGGAPLNRSKKENKVENIAAIF